MYPFTALFFATLLGSCSLYDNTATENETLRIFLPPPHPLYALAFPEITPSYTIRWYTENGRALVKSGVKHNTSIEVTKGIMTPVLLYPETGLLPLNTTLLPSFFLPPSGGIYPYQAEIREGNPILKTSWMNGIASRCAEEICTSSSGGFETGRSIASHFNWGRFTGILADFSDPLLLDRNRFVASVLSGKVTKYSIIPVETDLVSISLPDAILLENAQFISRWPEKSGISPSSPTTILVEAPEGLSYIFSSLGYLVIQLCDGKVMNNIYMLY